MTPKLTNNITIAVKAAKVSQVLQVSQILQSYQYQPIKLQKAFLSFTQNSFRRMSAAQTTQTFAVIFKERMMDMPDELNAKKDIDEYSKKITKEIKEEAKNNKIEKAEKKKDEKKKKKNNLDEDGNEKPKKPLTKYQQYIRDNQQRIRDEFPELSNTERFSKLAEEWKAYKATLENAEDVGDTAGEAGGEAGEATGDGDAEATDMEITNVSEDEEEKPKQAANAAKAAKKPKKEIKPKAKAEADE